MKNRYLYIILVLILIFTNLSYAVAEEDELIISLIDYDDDFIFIEVNNNSIELKKGQPIKFKVDEKEIFYPEDKKSNLSNIYVEILDGEMLDVEENYLIRDGIIYIETNLAEILIDKDGIFLHNKKTYKVDNGFKSKIEYNSKFTKEYKRILELKDTTNKINKDFNNLEAEFNLLRADLIKSYEDNIKEKDYNNKQLENRVKTLEGQLATNVKNNNENYSNKEGTESITVVEDNIYKSDQGSLQIIAEVPKSLEKLKQDIFIEIAKNSEEGETKLYYLSSFNNFRNSHQLKTGDYRVKSIFFLDPDLDKEYTFEHNKIAKVLENETTYFMISANDIKEEIADDLLFEDDVKPIMDEDVVADEINVDNNKSKKSLVIFLGILLILSIILIWRFNIINKIIYKE